MDVLVDRKLQLFKCVLEPGSGLQCPTEGSEVTVDVIGMRSERRTFVVGEGDEEIDDYLDSLVTSMKRGERCEFAVPSWCLPDRTESPTVTLQAALVDFSSVPEPWALSHDERLQKAAQLKERAGKLFKDKKWRLASRRYSRAIKKLIPAAGSATLSPECATELQHLKTTCHLNLAACQLHMQQYEHVVSNCTSALSVRADDVKGLYRRGHALVELNEFERAEADLSRALELVPGNKPVEAQMQKLRQKIRQQDDLYSKALKKMFSWCRLGSSVQNLTLSCTFCLSHWHDSAIEMFVPWRLDL